ncbi:MAG: zinc ribbon domain-containing protein, partial [Candidatus Babeliales bacterium]
MNQQSLQTLIALVEFDQELLAVERSVEKLQYELEEARKESTLCHEGLDRVQTAKHVYKKEVDLKELEMKTLDQEQKDARKRLDGAANQREYNSVLKEVEALQKKQNILEEELLALWKKYEHAEAEVKERKVECDNRLVSLNTVITEKMQAINSMQEKLAELKKVRDEKVKNVPEELMEKYNAMYKQVANPIVPIGKNSCSA